MPDGIEVERSGHGHTRCPYCHDDLGAEAEQTKCSGCHATYHAECWAELGDHCATCGESSSVESNATPAKHHAETRPAKHGPKTPLASRVDAPPPREFQGGYANTLTWVLLAQSIGLGLSTCLALLEAYAVVAAGGFTLVLSTPFLLGTGVTEKQPGLGVLVSVLNVVVGVVGAVMVDALNIKKRRPSGLLFVLALVYLLVTLGFAAYSRRRRPV